MKYIIFICFSIAFAKAVSSQIPQEDLAKIKIPYIDLENAPVNPIGPYHFTLQARNLRKDVFSIDFSQFDRKGNFIYTKEILNDLDKAIKEKKEYYKIENGFITENKKGYSNDISYYSYDNKGRVATYKNEFWNYSYKYDNKNRIVEKTSLRKENLTTMVTTYKYSNHGDQLRVDMIDIKESGEKNTYYKIFKNGLLVENLSGMGTIKWTYKFDHNGNFILKNHSNSYLDPRPRSILYYEDVDGFIAKGKIPWKKEEIVPKSKIAAPYIYVNNRTLKNISPARGIGDEVIFYLNLDQSYYSSKHAYKDKFDTTTTGEASLLHRGDKVIMLYDGKYLRLFDEGSTNKNLTYTSFGNDWIVRDTVEHIQYLVNNVDESKYVNPAKKFSRNSSFFGYDKKGSQYILFVNGLTPDYSRILKNKYTESGDPVVFYDGKPILILKGYFQMEEKGLLPAIPYNGEVLTDSRSQTEIEEDTSTLVEFNPQLGIKTQKFNESTFVFFQDGKQIKPPTYLIYDATENDILFGYGLEDFVIKNHASLELNKDFITSRIARENEIITHYIDGKLKYLYNNGEILTASDYTLSNVNNDKYLIYIFNINKTIIIDIKSPNDFEYIGAMTSNNNVWIKKGVKGMVLYKNGEFIKGDQYKWSLDSNGDAHIYINNRPTYYLQNYKAKATGQLYPVISHSGQLYAKNPNSNGELTKNAQSFIAAQKSNYASRATKKILIEIETSMTQNGLNTTQKSQKYADLFKELYLINKEYAFELMMKMDGKYLQKTQSFLTQDHIAYIRNRAKKELSSYEGAHSNVSKN